MGEPGVCASVCLPAASGLTLKRCTRPLWQSGHKWHSSPSCFHISFLTQKGIFEATALLFGLQTVCHLPNTTRDRSKVELLLGVFKKENEEGNLGWTHNLVWSFNSKLAHSTASPHFLLMKTRSKWIIESLGVVTNSRQLAKDNSKILQLNTAGWTLCLTGS